MSFDLNASSMQQRAPSDKFKLAESGDTQPDEAYLLQDL